MIDEQIEKALQEKTEELYQSFSSKKLSGLFRSHYESMKTGEAVLLNDDDEYPEMLKARAVDTSSDERFPDK